MSPRDRWAEDRWARVAWSRIAEPGVQRVGRWIEAHGAVGALERLRSGRLGEAEGYAARAGEIDLDDVARVLRVLGVRVVVPGDEEWPSGLDILTDPPPCLYVRGPLPLGPALERSVAVVGSRAATAYGTQTAWELGEGLVGRGATVVSGAAYGIDGAAHRGALAGEGPTVAVLACGPDRVYPQGHGALLAQIAATGAVVTEVPVGWAPLRSRFLARNRLIATMTLGTVVVEAGVRSGSLNTVGYARRYHRHIAAVPGPVTSVVSAGCHRIIREGGTLVTDAAEVLDLMGRLGLDGVDTIRADDSPDGNLDPQDHLVWSAVPVRRASTVAEVAGVTGQSTAVVRAAIARLELLGLVRREGEAWLKRPLPRSG